MGGDVGSGGGGQEERRGEVLRSQQLFSLAKGGVGADWPLVVLVQLQDEPLGGRPNRRHRRVRRHLLTMNGPLLKSKSALAVVTKPKNILK